MVLFTILLLRLVEGFFLIGMEAIWHVEEYKTLIRFGWYLGYALIYMSCFFSIVSNTFNNGLNKLATVQLLLGSLFFMGTLEVARYVDRFIIKSDALGVFYASSQAICNLIVTACAVMIAVKVLAGKLYYKKDLYADYL
ncbi:hypothetical protein HMF8227_01257 [Saliniradius amylolyticus]|uniref:Uncharacterized protein n=2 Tax=Saliniradius amylolyticus TaxID=2183582 RepID=A0A2S2E257_9ALTE|nr:hypothetical protein HMF8227_01257 [Saliniradius amylolyticus]